MLNISDWGRNYVNTKCASAERTRTKYPRIKRNVTLARPSQREDIAWLEPQKQQKFKFIAALEIPARKDESTCRLLAETSLF